MDEFSDKLSSGELEGNWGLSIMDMADDFIMRGNCRGILRITFDDIEASWAGRKLATPQDIVRIFNWCRDKDGIAVHCYSGVSRSSAIAYLIECLEQLPEKAIEILNADKHSPNSHIIRIGAEILNAMEILTCLMRWMEDNERIILEATDY